MAAKKINVKTIMLTLGAVLLLCGLAVLLLAWRSMSYDPAPTPAAQAETFTLRFDDFSMALPTSFTFSEFSVSLNWADARIIVREGWQPNNEAGLSRFEEAKTALDEKYELVDISAEMGFPAVMTTEIPEIDLADKPHMLISLLCENVQLGFVLMSPSPPADRAALAETMKSRVRDFMRYYHPSPTREVSADVEMRTRYGTVEQGPRDGYVFTLAFAYSIRGESNFSFSTITDAERLVLRPGFDSKISRFFTNLSASGVISGIGIEELSLDSAPGHEILRKHPYLISKPVAIEFEWQEAPKDGLYAKYLALCIKGTEVADPAARYGEWKQILESVRFSK